MVSPKPVWCPRKPRKPHTQLVAVKELGMVSPETRMCPRKPDPADTAAVETGVGTASVAADVELAAEPLF